MIDWIIPEKINTPCMEDIENTLSPPSLWASHRHLTSHLPGHSGFKSPTSPWTCIIQHIVGLNLQAFCLLNLSIHLTTMTFTKCSPLNKLLSTCLPPLDILRHFSSPLPGWQAFPLWRRHGSLWNDPL